MNFSEWWQALVLPDRWRICGIRVRALSVWHLYALEQAGNAFMYGRKPTLDDCASLILICQTNFDTGRELFTFEQGVIHKTKRIFKQLKNVDRDELLDACSDYFKTCTVKPERWVSEKRNGHSMAAPLCRHIVLCLTGEYNMTVDEAWNHSCADARCMYETWREKEGDTSLVSEYQKTLIEEATRIKNEAGIK